MNEKIKRAFVFPGQGSQFIGMGKNLFDNFAEAREVFEEVCDSLGFNLTKIIFEGLDSELALTQNTQPALMTVSMAVVRVFNKIAGEDISKLGEFVAGHSLGEYSALCASRSISLRDTASLLKIRGTEMQKACAPGQGAMAAVIGMPLLQLEKILLACREDGVCQVANDNSESQVVISGAVNAIDRAVATIKDLGFKAIKLNVSTPFHSSFMKPAALAMEQALRDIQVKTPNLRFVANVHATEVTDPNDIKKSLVQQVEGSVRWRETIDYFEAQGVNKIVELGAGKVLTGLLKRSSKNFALTNIESTEDIENFLKGIE
jgi:[acyl-carrier-protein] S-malonyltransferase